ncbi:hypothetical protein [Roseibium marinum]|uniref:PLL-like beta propeller domain-containing protein n=1 Tax=Roseibium marinum TaxID=281252 RepID=A0A2S3UPJ2_9HYPH|nr:hypothetical protein [Roseibium marinum]POF29616.1 hypothetical protein CLV41_10839 [Roseibium marinum]
MSVEEAIPGEFEGIVHTAPSYFRIFVAAVSPDGELEYKDQKSENGPFYNYFTRLTQSAYATDRLNASVTQEGYVALLAQDAQSANLIYLHESNTPDAANRFADPEDLGKPDGVTGFTDTALINGLTGRQNIFATSSAAGNALWWKYQNVNRIEQKTITVVPPGTDTPIEITVPVEVPPDRPWSDWLQIPGALCSLAPVQNADGRIIMFGMDSDAVPYMNFQSSDHPFLPEKWEGWQDIRGGLTGFEQLVGCIDGNALVHVFARIGSRIYMKVQEEVSSNTFSEWVLFGSFSAPVHTMTVAVSSNDGLYLAAQVGSGPNSPVYGSYQTGGADRNWSALRIIAHVKSDSTLVLQSNADENLSLFALDSSSGNAFYLNQLSLDHWSAVWNSLGDNPLSAIALTQDITPNPH